MREMKNSGVEWIGEIPAIWTVSKLKNYIKCYDGRRVPIDSAKRVSGPYPYWGAGSITDYVDDYLFDEELILLGEDGAPFFDDTRPVAFLINEKIWANNHIHVIKPLPLINASFLVNYLNIVDYGTYINGSILSKLTQSNMNNISLVVPSLDEQHRIADFLDKKCAKIDVVIEKQKQVIEKLKEYKLSVITEAVTKGLDPAVPMKDSGVEWIGEIPEKWSVTKASRIIVNTQNGLTRRDLDISAGNIVLKLKNIYADGRINYSDTNRIALTDKEIASYRLQDGDFLFVRVNGSKHLVGKCAIYKEISEVVAYNDHIIRVRLNNLCNKRFFQLYLMSVPGKREIDLHTSTAAGQFTISGEGLRDIIVLLPDISEQKIIVEYLDKIICKIDSAIAKKQSIIEKLTEYKKSLIYEVVTGKREVLL